MIKTAICDNNLNNAIIIKNSIEQFSNKFRLRCDISIYTSGNELIIDHHKYKAIFINTNIKDKARTILPDTFECRVKKQGLFLFPTMKEQHAKL